MKKVSYQQNQMLSFIFWTISNKRPSILSLSKMTYLQLLWQIINPCLVMNHLELLSIRVCFLEAAHVRSSDYKSEQQFCDSNVGVTADSPCPPGGFLVRLLLQFLWWGQAPMFWCFSFCEMHFVLTREPIFYLTCMYLFLAAGSSRLHMGFL